MKVFQLVTWCGLLLLSLSIARADSYVLEPGLPDAPLVWNSYGKPFDKFMGVTAFSNKANGKGGKYQCTELIHRFIDQVYGIPSKIGMGLGHAKNVVGGIVRFFDKVYETPQGRIKLVHYKASSRKLPVVGSVISFASGPYGKFGHVAVVRQTELLSDDEFKIILFEQHGKRRFEVGKVKPLSEIKFFRDSEDRWNTNHTVEWLTPEFVL